MNIEAYNLDSLRKIVRELQEENRILKEQLKQSGLAVNVQDHFSDRIEEIEEYDPDQGARIYRTFITRDHAVKFFTMFWGRKDVYARRGRKGGYFPQCANRWNPLCQMRSIYGFLKTPDRHMKSASATASLKRMCSKLWIA